MDIAHAPICLLPGCRGKWQEGNDRGAWILFYVVNVFETEMQRNEL